MTKQELVGMAADIVTALPGSRVEVHGIGEFSTDDKGRVIFDAGFDDDEEAQCHECPGERGMKRDE